MARIRTIKPEFFKHSGLFDLEQRTGLPIRLAFEGLWVCADKAGRFKWRPRELKLDALPYDDCDFALVLDALAADDYIAHYTHNGESYGFIPTWRVHQFLNYREPDSILPDPQQGQIVDASATREERVNNVKGKGNVNERINNKTRDARVPLASSTRQHFDISALPSWITPDTWLAFEESRKRLRAPMTDRARKNIVTELYRLKGQGESPDSVLDQSITNGWKGVFPLRPADSNHHPGGFNGKGDSAVDLAREYLTENCPGSDAVSDLSGSQNGQNPTGALLEAFSAGKRR